MFAGVEVVAAGEGFLSVVLPCFCSFQYHAALRVRPPCLASAGSMGGSFVRFGGLRRRGHMDVGKSHPHIKRLPWCDSYLVRIKCGFAYYADIANIFSSSCSFENDGNGCEVVLGDVLLKLIFCWGFKPA